MKALKRSLLFTVILLTSLSAATISFAEGSQEKTEYLSFSGKHDPVWKLEAPDLLLIGGYGDNFNYDGTKVKPLDGKASVEINTETNTGIMEVVFNGTINPEKGKTYNGEIRIVYDKFAEGSDFWEGGIADFVFLHGDTKQEAPVMPKLRTYLATWGPADIYVDGQLVYEALAGHMMYTERSRDKETFAISNKDRSGFYSPKEPSNFSIANPNEKEIHFVVHTTVGDKGNFPPHTVLLHLNFRSIKELR